MKINRLRKSLKRHEGKRLLPYEDQVGKLTIGFGRNLTDNGISEEEADFLLDGDIGTAVHEAQVRVACWPMLDHARQEVIVEMIFNLGWPRLAGFVKFLAALERADYTMASVEMLDSKWALQVGKRADRLSRQMRDGDAARTHA